mmetsp:Transcript_15479/g.23517  ORF Transcript_15479/g.23517 Transcript_15479/m.23517 type:complete len:383 (+) Transcript_15479:141-1289(+)
MSSPYVSTEIALAVIPKITGLISFLCSSYIVQHVLRNPKRRSQTYHRILLGMSMGDMVGSFSNFLSTWPIPAGEAWWAIGSTLSCDITGFIDQLGSLVTPLYSGSLATFYVLQLRLEFTKHKIKKVEWLFHAFPIGLGIGFATAGSFLKLYSNAGFICWIAPYPDDCDSPETCIRGWNYNFYRIAFMYAWVWATLLYVAISMLVIFVHTHRVEKSADKYRFSGKDRKKSEAVAFQAFLYVGSFFSTWIFGSIARILRAITGKTFYSILILMATFFPLGGFFNFCIYCRPRYLKAREKNKEASSFLIVNSIFSKTVKPILPTNKKPTKEDTTNEECSSPATSKKTTKEDTTNEECTPPAPLHIDKILFEKSEQERNHEDDDYY